MERMHATVTEKALRDLVNELLDAGNAPVPVNAVVDPSAAQTDPTNDAFVPQTRPELDVAVRELTKELPVERVPSAYKAVKDAIDNELADAEEHNVKNIDETRRIDAQRCEWGKCDGVNVDGRCTRCMQRQNVRLAEETVRRAVRSAVRQLDEAGAPTDIPPEKITRVPYGVSGRDRDRQFKKDVEDLRHRLRHDDSGGQRSRRTGPKRAYKKTAIGGMHDVSGAKFEDIAAELGFAVSGAKQAVDKALLKAQRLASMDPDELEILVLTTMNDYIEQLQATGELSDDDVRLMKDHPDIVRGLDGFRQFLDAKMRGSSSRGAAKIAATKSANENTIIAVARKRVAQLRLVEEAMGSQKKSR